MLLQAASAVARGGNVTVTLSPLPEPGSDSATLAPCASAIAFTIASPSPLPGGAVPAREIRWILAEARSRFRRPEFTSGALLLAVNLDHCANERPGSLTAVDESNSYRRPVKPFK